MYEVNEPLEENNLKHDILNNLSTQAQKTTHTDVDKKQQREQLRQIRKKIDTQQSEIDKLTQAIKLQTMDLQSYEKKIESLADKLYISDQKAQQLGGQYKECITPYNVHNVSQNYYSYQYLCSCLSLMSTAILTVGYFLFSKQKNEFDRLKLKTAFTANISLHILIFVLMQLFYEENKQNSLLVTPYHFKT